MLRFFLVLVTLFWPFSIYAQENSLEEMKGTNGDELICLGVNPKDPATVYLGTDKGLYFKNKVSNEWQRLLNPLGENIRVNKVLISVENDEAYVATAKGVYVLDLKSHSSRIIYSKSSGLEADCTSVCRLSDGEVYIGTKAGLFFKISQQGEWQKISSPLDSRKIVSLYGIDQKVYAAINSGVYKLNKDNEQWEKILNVYSYADVPEYVEDTSQEADQEGEPSVVRYVTGLEQSPTSLYVASRYGIFFTENDGKKWDRLSLTGLDYSNLRFLVIDQAVKKIYAVVKNGVYCLKNDRWSLMASAYDCRQAILSGKSIVLITTRDVLEFPLDVLPEDLTKKIENTVENYKNEPTIQEVQKMAISYSETSDKKIQTWRRQAQVKAFLPEVSLDLDKTITTALGASYDKIQIGPMDWGVSLKWDLANLIFNSDQTSIDTRSKLMVELRNDVLAEVTRLYFERRKLQMELISQKKNSDKELRIAELTAMIDRLTNNKFSSSIK